MSGPMNQSRTLLLRQTKAAGSTYILGIVQERGVVEGANRVVLYQSLACPYYPAIC